MRSAYFLSEKKLNKKSPAVRGHSVSDRVPAHGGASDSGCCYIVDTKFCEHVRSALEEAATSRAESYCWLFC